MHTENVTATDLIRAAVVAQLAKPAVAPSNLWLTTRTIRLQLLTWAGIIGGSVTIFSNLRGFLNLADWARWIVTHWHESTQAFWTAAFSWIGIHIHHAFVPLLSFTVFLVMVVTGTVLRTANPTLPDSSSTTIRSKRQLLRSIAGQLGIYVIWAMAYFAVLAITVNYLLELRFSMHTMAPLVQFMLATYLLVPLAALILASKERLQCLALVTLLTLFWFALALGPISRIAGAAISPSEIIDTSVADMAGYSGFFSIWLVTIGVIAIDILAPVKSINQRLLFLAMGTLSLVALNMISVFALHRLLEAPDPHCRSLCRGVTPASRRRPSRWRSISGFRP